MSKTELTTMLETIKTRDDLVEFINVLCSSLSHEPGEWENIDLLPYLESMAAWVGDIDGYYANRGTPFNENQPWKMIAEILLASSMYE